MQYDSGIPDPLLGGHVWRLCLSLEQAPGLRTEGQEKAGVGGGLTGAQALDQLLPLRAQAPGPPAVYLEKNGNTIPGGENYRG